ncbi:MAG: isochorismate synthase [Lawsonella sp.]|uniref:isochorismate synthase n=1 Tax=Lawsonella sp. TaxID=2041415 RepID=UPI002A7590A1|nr:isochorismate synthase [Lawsonella sp.]MDY2978934.1 isochorismate synthase [Lawsonella sp.]
MEPEKPSQPWQHHLHSRPRTAPDFLLSRATGSVRTKGVKETFSSVAAAREALASGRAEMIVGALPFTPGAPAALSSPRQIIRSDAPLEPPAFFRVQQMRARITAFSPTASEHRRRVQQAVEAIRDGVADKIVLARAVNVSADEELDPQLIAARLLDGSPRQEAYLADLSPAGADYAGHWLVGSSPELLVSRRGNRISSHPLAGSLARHSDRQLDAQAARALRTSAKDIAEHRYVTLALDEALRPLCSNLDIPDTPSLTSTKEMWHLGTHITGTLAETVPHGSTAVSSLPTALDLAELLHPTPAVGGWPRQEALKFIADSGEERRFYAGTVGWCDAEGNGDWVVAIRCAELDLAHNSATAWAGGGIVVDSRPSDEVQETRDKLRTILRALGIMDDDA